MPYERYTYAVPGGPNRTFVRGVTPDEGVAGGLGLVVGLRLDDDPGRTRVGDHAADEVPRDLEDRPVVELRARHGRARAARAPGASAVPPSETFDSSHDCALSTA